MAVLLMIYRKMVRNKWLIFSLLIGFVFFIALMCSIPLYTNGIMQSLLDKEFETQQLERNQYPGNIKIDSDYEYYVGGYDTRKRLYDSVTQFIEGDFIQNVGIPNIQKVYYHQTSSWIVEEDFRQRQVPDDRLTFKFACYTDMEQNLTIIDGRLPSETADDGIYEVMITDSTMHLNHLAIGDMFTVKNSKLKNFGIIKIKIVGVFAPSFVNELYWFDNLANSRNSIFLNGKLFADTFLASEGYYIDHTTWYYAMDYLRINVDNVEQVFGRYEELSKWIKNKGFYAYIPTMGSLPNYKAQQARLVPLLLSLYGPIIIMLLFYLFMVSSLVVDKQKNEIAVLISRGAGRSQLMLIYFLEALILGAVGMMAGPFLGVFLTRILGSTSNFLEFVNRKALQIHINRETILYALFGAALSIITTLLPTYFATGVNILEHKRGSGRNSSSPLWKRFYLDFVLLAVSLYGYFQFIQRQKDLVQTSAESLSIDPLLFVVSAIFSLSLGLIFIRIFPWLVEGLYRLGRRFWPLSVYTSLIQVARSASSYQFLMLFIVITVSTGIFSATAARTINRNAEDKIRYENGTDHIVTALWAQNGIFISDLELPPGVMGPPAEEETPLSSALYEEPPYNVYAELEGVESTAKVLDIEARIYGKQSTHAVKLMAIDPQQFAKTAWFPDGLTPKHWFNDINQMSISQSMVLISRSIADKLDLKQWDTFTMNWSPNGMADFMVAGIIDYWPTWNPNLKMDRDNGIYDMLVVGHLNYIYENSVLQPYSVWIRMKPDSSTEGLYDGIKDHKLKIQSITDINKDFIALNRDPVHLGLNGALTLVFLISIVIILSGFIMFWILAMYARMFQSGIMMAMGMRLRELISMMTWEQLLTTVVPIFFGAGIGGLSSTLFVPMLQMSFSAKDQIPPFRVVAYISDYIRIYVILGVMVLIGLLMIAYMLSKLNIFSSIKLGEDG